MPVTDAIIGAETPILVTGAAGFIGKSVVRTLLENGFRDVRCFVRPSRDPSPIEALECSLGVRARIQAIRGNLLSREDCLAATRNVAVVYHLAAGTEEKSFSNVFMNSVVASRNLMDAFLEVGRPKRFVNVSSFAVYSNLSLKCGTLLDETCPLEDAPQERYDAYCFVCP